MHISEVIKYNAELKQNLVKFMLKNNINFSKVSLKGRYK